MATMTLTQLGGAFLIFLLCPLMGGLPLTGWLTWLVSGKRLAKLGTGNVGVSAAFYHGGTVAGVLSVLAEAAKGIGAVLLARSFFPSDATWEVVAMIALVMGRYWLGQGAGTTNVVWGFVVHDPITAGITFILSGISFTLFRERQQGRLLVLVLVPILTALRHQDGDRVMAVVLLSSLLAWIYHKLPDDLALPTGQSRVESQKLFQFFRGDRALLSLDQALAVHKVGQKAATLAQLRRWGYPVPRGYVLPAGDDPAPLLAIAQPSLEDPLVVRSSAVGEDSLTASAAGQYASFLGITTSEALAIAIARCFGSYNAPSAVHYRRDRGLPEASMAVIVQQQVKGIFSGVAFSRDPIRRYGDAVLIEALPGGADQVVSGRNTPARYRVRVQPDDIAPFPPDTADENWRLPAVLTLTIESQPDGQDSRPQPIPERLIQQVAFLTRHLEQRYHGIPQDVEWSYDGEQIWVLQSRPITTLLPIWTRKIAAEVIPGSIPPLTWSINRPLTCGVWGDLFTLVLGQRAKGLAFEDTATLHHSRAYFNASLLGELFQRMGLPPESLEFLTRGAPFSKPPLRSTLRNSPGLLRLIQRELRLVADFNQIEQIQFIPALARFARTPAATLSAEDLGERIEHLLALLREATYYSILAPLSFAIRKAILKVPDELLDSSLNPEIAALEELRSLADASRPILTSLEYQPESGSALFALLAERVEGQAILTQLDRFIAKYSCLSEASTNIAVPTWKENPGPVRALFTQLLLNPPPQQTITSPQPSQHLPSWKLNQVQTRLDLKGRVTAIYTRLLAELRWTVLALAQLGVQAGMLEQVSDVFYLTLPELTHLIQGAEASTVTQLREQLQARQFQFAQDKTLEPAPLLVYGHEPLAFRPEFASADRPQHGYILTGIGASPGRVEGQIWILRSLNDLTLDDPIPGKQLSSGDAPGGSPERHTILVVPYTDSGWAPVLARASGLIAEVGGQLSHGAIVAREYGIPAVMNIPDATQRFHNGQRVRIDGQLGTVEILA